MIKKHMAAAILVATTFFISQGTLAQDAGKHLYGSQDQFGLQVGMTLRVPLGEKRSNRRADRTTLQLGISSTRFQAASVLESRTQLTSDLFAIGFDDRLYPRLTLSGMDLSRQTFPSLYANDPESDEDLPPNKTNGALMIVGGIAVLGGIGVLVAAEAEDDIEDAARCVFSQIIGPEECE